jgi:hypothetical protein
MNNMLYIKHIQDKYSQSPSYFTTDGQSVSQSVCLDVEPTLGLVTRYYFLSEGCCMKVAVLSLWCALSDERTSLQFAMQSLNGPSCTEPVTILDCLIWDSPNLKEQVPIFISLRNRVVQLYTRALGYYILCIKHMEDKHNFTIIST